MKNKKCKVCGGDFLATLQSYVYCGNRCRAIAASEKRRKYKEAIRRELDHKMDRRCQICAAALVLGSGKQKYCSKECAKTADMRQREAMRAAERQVIQDLRRQGKYIGAIGELCAMPTCGRFIIGRRATAKFCSHECKLAWDKLGIRKNTPLNHQERKPKKEFGCDGCAHNRENKAADTGYECAIHAMLKCRPYGERAMYKAK